MLEALWSVKFINTNNSDYGAGIIILENGLIRGGDSNYYYKGDYRVVDGVLYAEVGIHHYFGANNNIFGSANDYYVSLTGKADYHSFVLTGEENSSKQHVGIKLDRLAEITP